MNDPLHEVLESVFLIVEARAYPGETEKHLALLGELDQWCRLQDVLEQVMPHE